MTASHRLCTGLLVCGGITTPALCLPCVTAALWAFCGVWRRGVSVVVSLRSLNAVFGLKFVNAQYGING